MIYITKNVSIRLTQSLLVAAIASVTCAVAAGTEVPSGAPVPAKKSAKASPVFTLKALINGDRACYVVLANKAGEKEREGAFELCAGGPNDASALIGKRVTFTTERAKVTAASCAGNIDCGKSDVVNLIVSLTAAPEIIVRK
nr:hypothetical protein [uncultured Undibacterium sp.]